ncbi:MAG: hypothetical protein K6C97_02150 [Treponema sp.]|nr:hypothetical protein [Treponema sp.]
MNKLNLRFSNFEKVLLAIILGLVLAIILGTIAAKAHQKTQTPEVLISKGKAVSLMAPADDEEIAYYELGTLRIVTAQEKEEELTSVLVISPWLAYPAGDTVFFEEIARKKGLVKGLFQAYFSSRTKNQLLEETEVKIEDNLKNQINAQFSLGQISDIYLTDYIFLE